MRILRITSLTLLFLLAPFAHGQSNGYPPCSAAELRWVQSLKTDYNALLARMTGGDTSLEQAIEYSRAQIAWREKLWSDLPPCAEAIDVAVRMSEIASDYGAMAALTYSGLSLSLNRYKDRLYLEGNQRDRLEEQLEAIAGLIESGDRPTKPAPGERSPVGCSDEDVKSLILALLDNEDLIVSAFDIGSSSDLLDYIKRLLEWRDLVWEQLPACTESVDVGRLMSQVAADIATAIAYSHAAVPASDNPFGGVLENELNQLGFWLEDMLERSGGIDDLEPAEAEEGNLPPCSAQALAALADGLYGASDLVESAFDIESTAGLLEHSRRLVAWRNELISRLPYCAEAVETGMLVFNFLGDLVSMLALGYADIPAEDNPYWEQVSANLPLVYEALDRFASSGGAPETMTDVARILPACTDAEHESFILLGTEFELYRKQASEFESVDDLLEFSNVHLFMRENNWQYLPPCQEAIQTGLLLIQLTGDAVPAAAFHLFAGVATEENPYWQQLSATRESIIELLAAFFAE